MGSKAYHEKKFYCGRTIAITLADDSIQLLDKWVKEIKEIKRLS